MSINIKLTPTDLLQNKVDATVFFVEQGFEIENLKSLSSEHSYLKRILADKKFSGKSGSLVCAPVVNANSTYFMFLGLGKKDSKNVINVENYRRALGNFVRALPQFNIKSAAFELPRAEIFGVSVEYLAKQTSTILQMADYVFDDFITEESRIINLNTEISVVVKENELKDAQHGIDVGLIVSDAINDAREWVDLPSNKMTPQDFSANAEAIALKYGLECKIFHETDINKMGMGGISAVASGSEKDAQLIIMQYKCGVKDAPTVCFIGKGITFDSGGLSIKPAVHMETMKEDMSGAAAVIASMKALAQLKPKINIVALAPVTENMPSGTSVKPGDIVSFYNGKTAEIKNTDAEGRLILADAMSYAVKHFKIDAMIDLATLTGACAYALGPFFSGLFSEHDEFVDKVYKASHLAGENVWRLPLTDDYKGAVKSEVADLCNIGRKEYQAGATTAACFLQNFVDDVPWVHLDIAGTAFNVPDISYYRRYSATGVGVRILVELAMNWNK